VRSLVAQLTGREPDKHGVARGYLLALGVAALSKIKDAFITKARGGTDEMGITWPPLSKAYLAYGRRFGRGEQAALKKSAGLGKQHRFAPGGDKGLLTADQLKQWNRIFARKAARFALSGEPNPKAHAAAVAWIVMKSLGAKTKLEVFGNRQVEILRDTGVLFNSISPGIVSGDGSYTPQDQQIFDIRAASVTVGSNVPYANVHDKGHARRPTMPRRQIFPDSESQIPESWWQDWLDRSARALESGAALVMRGLAA